MGHPHTYTCRVSHLGTCTPWTPGSLASPPPRLKPHPRDHAEPSGAPPSPTRSRNPYLSELGSSFLLLHAAVGHEVVKYFSCGAKAEGVRAGHGGGCPVSRAGPVGEGPHQRLHTPSPGTASSRSQSPRRASLQGAEGRRSRGKRPPTLHPHSATVRTCPTMAPLTQGYSAAPY